MLETKLATPPWPVLRLVIMFWQPSQPMRLQVQRLDVNLPGHVHLILNVLVLAIGGLCLELSFQLPQPVQIQRCCAHLGQLVLVPFVRLRKPKNGVSKLDGVAVMDHALASASARASKDTHVPNAAISETGHWLVTSMLVAAHLAEG